MKGKSRGGRETLLSKFCFCACHNFWENFSTYQNIVSSTVKPLLSGHLRDLPKCPLNRGSPLNKGL